VVGASIHTSSCAPTSRLSPLSGDDDIRNLFE
jgi:hypothetical protein